MARNCSQHKPANDKITESHEHKSNEVGGAAHRIMGTHEHGIMGADDHGEHRIMGGQKHGEIQDHGGT